MKISIITPSFNQGQFIEECVLSVLNQGYNDFEHIIVDGGSNDNTIELLKKYKHLIWISEKDRGLSHALNKALSMVTGDIIGWLNTDDYYCPNTFENASKHFNDKNVDWIVGFQKLLFSSINHISEGKKGEITVNSLKKNCDNIRTNAMFFRANILKEIGGFDEHYKMVMDYDICIRLSKKYKIVNTHEFYHVMRLYDEQITSYSNRYIQLFEIYRVAFGQKNLQVAINKTFIVLRSDVKVLIKKVLICCGLLSEKYKKFPLKRKHELK